MLIYRVRRCSLKLLLFIVISLWINVSESAVAASAGAGRITFLEGEVLVKIKPGVPEQQATLNLVVGPGSRLTTKDTGRLELTLPDESIVRLGPSSVYRIKLSRFQGINRRRFTADLNRGRMWVNARRSPFSTSESFQITTPSAVVGIRGTTYDLIANPDKSAQVSVFEGSVGVAPAPVEAGAAHEEIAWPVEISESEWEEIILGQLQRLNIGPDGKPAQPRAFSPDVDKDEWVEWNRNRDQDQTH